MTLTFFFIQNVTLWWSEQKTMLSGFKTELESYLAFALIWWNQADTVFASSLPIILNSGNTLEVWQHRNHVMWLHWVDNLKSTNISPTFNVGLFVRFICKATENKMVQINAAQHPLKPKRGKNGYRFNTSLQISLANLKANIFLYVHVLALMLT